MSWIPAFARLAEALAKRAGMTGEIAPNPFFMSASDHPTERKAARISSLEKPSFKQRAIYSFSSICQDTFKRLMLVILNAVKDLKGSDFKRFFATLRMTIQLFNNLLLKLS